MTPDEVNELGRHYMPISHLRGRRRREIRMARPVRQRHSPPQLRKLGYLTIMIEQGIGDKLSWGGWLKKFLGIT